MKNSPLCWLALALCVLALTHAKTVHKQQAPDALSYVEQADDKQAVDKEVDELSEDERIKRSGGKHVAGLVGNTLRTGVSLGLSNLASAVAVKGGKHGVQARTFGGGYDHHGGYDIEHDDHHHHEKESKKADIWTFKKSIFTTLASAVKALTGGVIGLSGKVTGGLGHVVEAKGRLLQTAGHSIYDFGRHVSQKALAPPPHVELPHHVVPHVHTHYEHVPLGYGASGHGAGVASPLFSSYGGNAGLGHEYGAPHYHVARAAKPAPAAHHKSDAKAGLLVLKPIHVPSHVKYQAQSNNLHDAPSTAYDSYAPPPPAQPKGRSNKLSQAESAQVDYQQYQESAPRGVYKHQQPLYQQQQQQLLSVAPSTHYQSYVSAPKAVQRSYNVAPMQYHPSLGYALPSIEYEY